jgi:hypothetical protein
MTNEELLDLFQGLNRCGNLSGAKFSYAIARNINALKPIVKTFEEARIALVESYCKKGEDGKPIMKDGAYTFDDQSEFDKEYKKLQKEEAQFSTQTFKINMSDIPEAITAAQMTGISSLVEEATPPKR